ncbi:unnamed protein product, partial [Aphanomyces euteiches]
RLATLVVNDTINVIAFDLPGNGLTSADAAGGWTLDNTKFIAAVAEAITLLIHQRPQARFVLVGHSGGGHIAIQVAALMADGVLHGVALLNSAGFRPHSTHWSHDQVVAMAKMSAGSPVGRQKLIRLLRPFLLKTGVPPSILDDEIAYSFQRTVLSDYAIIRANVQELVKRQMPFFIANAADDPIIKRDICDELVAVVSPQVHLQLETGGHNIQKSRAHEIATALQDWIATPQPSRL